MTAVGELQTDRSDICASVLRASTDETLHNNTTEISHQSREHCKKSKRKFCRNLSQRKNR